MSTCLVQQSVSVEWVMRNLGSWAVSFLGSAWRNQLRYDTSSAEPFFNIVTAATEQRAFTRFQDMEEVLDDIGKNVINIEFLPWASGSFHVVASLPDKIGIGVDLVLQEDAEYVLDYSCEVDSYNGEMLVPFGPIEREPYETNLVSFLVMPRTVCGGMLEFCLVSCYPGRPATFIDLAEEGYGSEDKVSGSELIDLGVQFGYESTE